MRILRKPHPFIFNIYSLLVPGLITFLIIFFLAPYGMGNMDSPVRTLFALGFSLVITFAVGSTVKLFQRFFPIWMDADNWTIGKEITLILSVLAIICLLVFAIISQISIQEINAFDLFLQIVFKTMVISFLPILVMVLFEQYTHQRAINIELQGLNSKLQHHYEKHEKSIDIRSENGKLAITLPVKQIVYIKADGNYVDLYYLDKEGQFKKELIRNRLKEIQDQLTSGSFFNCHKSYLVNLDHLQKVNGNARNFEIILQHTDHPIPVSRSKAAELKSQLAASTASH